MVTAASECHLLQQRNLNLADLHSPHTFTSLKTFVDESHLIRSLVQCNRCGQLYFYEFFEEIDWQGGNDPQYRTFIPVDSYESAEEMSRMPRSGLVVLVPRIQIDWPADKLRPEVKWIGG